MGEIRIDIYTLLCIKQITNENVLYTQGTLLTALWPTKWERNPKERGNVYTSLIHFAVQKKLTL